MASPIGQRRRPWLWPAVAGLCGLALAVSLFRLPKAPRAPAPAPKALLEVRGLASDRPDPLFHDTADFNDPTPLFLPTRWNSAPPEPPRREPGGEFNGYPPKYVFDENDLRLNLAQPIRVPSNPAAALTENPPGNPFQGVGRTGATVPALPSRWAAIEVADAATGRLVLARELTRVSDAGDLPDTFKDGSWEPVEFMAAVDAAGLVGSLVPTARLDSPVEGTMLQVSGDSLAALEKFLAVRFRIGDRLAPGFYRISVGP